MNYVPSSASRSRSVGRRLAVAVAVRSRRTARPRRVRPLVTSLFALAMLLALFPLPNDRIASALTVDVGTSNLAFRNTPTSVTDIGYLAPAGFSHRYDDVVSVGGQNIDAIVTVLSATNIDSDDDSDDGADGLLDHLDEGDGADDSAIDLGLDVFGRDCDITSTPPCTGNVVLRVAFVQDGSNAAATLQNVKINVKDVDSRQFVQFSAVRSYKLNPESYLTVSTPSTGSTRFTAPAISSSTSNELHWVEVDFAELSFLDITLGANESGSAFFGIGFSSPAWSSEPDLTTIAAPSYTITYDNNGSADPVPSPTTGSGPQTIASAPARTGYTFANWNTAADGSGVSVPAGSSYTPASSLTLYAQWTSDEEGATVTFDANGGSGSMTAQTESSATALTANGFTRVGYTFSGWNTAADGSGTSYADSASYPFTASTTLYAQWSANTLTVSYDSQGGSAIAAGSTTTGSSVAASPGTPTRAGYGFNGWFAASSGGTQISFPYTHNQTANFTLYAQWSANTLTVSYDSQGGSAIAAGSTTTGSSVAASPGTPTRAGYGFNGWFAASSGGTAISFPYTHNQTANFTLYAQWRRQPTFNVLSGDPSVNTSFLLVASSGDMRTALSSNTPTVCSVVGFSVVFVSPGDCRVTATADGAEVHTFAARVISTASTAVKSSGQSDKLPGAKIPQGTRRLNVRAVYFGPDSAALTNETRRELRALLDELRRAGTVIVTGHAADAGDPTNAVALTLSQRRAKAIADFLNVRDVTVSIETARGRTQPASIVRALNRRVEIAWYTPDN